MSEPREHSSVPSTNRSSVLLVVSSYLPHLGGLQRVTSQLSRELQIRGYRVQVVTQKHPRALPAREVIDGVPVQRWHFITPRLRDLFRGRLVMFVAGVFIFPITLARLIRYIAREKPDAVNLHFLGAPALFVLIARKFRRFRCVASLHGDDVEGLKRGNWFDRWVFRTTLRNVDVVTACSRYLLERTLSVEPRILEKALVIYNGVDLSQLSNVPLPESSKIREIINDSEVNQEIRLLAVGRMVPKKGLDVLLKAFAVLLQDVPYSRLVLVGDGPEQNSLRLLTRDLALDGKVEWRGAQNLARVIQEMALSHILIIPSREEPFGMVALEAMAIGKPIVASRVGGLPEVLDGADAVFVCADEPNELANAIKQALRCIERDPNYGTRNREIASQFSLARMADQYEMVYAVSPTTRT
jgi:glycogen synthase